jgi:GT2 family glycosyltransferase/radical SAM superfamily enzyme YgiQ (UPF0313 family)
MQKILLSNPPWHKKGLYGVRAGSRWPHFEAEGCEYMPFPFFLAHACSLLEKYGYKPKVIDSLALKQTRKDFYQDVAKFAPDLIAMEVSSFSMENDLEIARELRKQHPSMKIVFMGIDADMHDEPFLRANEEVDYVLAGEYEETLLELAYNLDHGDPFKKIPGCVFLDQNKNYSGFERRSLIRELDILPWPSRDQLPMDKYSDEPGNIPRPSVQMWGSRGCPFQCIFCAWPQIMYGSNLYRIRSIKDMADEFEWLVTEWGFKSVYFDDDTFNVNKRRIGEFCKELIRRGLKVPWAAMCRADLIDEPLLKLMKESGVHALKFGVESATQCSLDSMQKHLDIEKVVQNINLTHNYGIQTHLTFMFGLPGETRESCERTLDLALKLNPCSLQMTLASPFPGSKFMKFLQDKNHLVKSVTEADGFRTSCVRTDAMTAEELEEFVQYANNKWLIHKASQRPLTVPGWKRKGLVSIIIPNYNGEAFIRNCVQSALTQDYQNVEVIVVDNDSTDKSVSIIHNNFPQVKLIEFPNNNGFSYAVNAGIDVAKGDFIALLNPDAKAEPSWIRSLVNAVNEEPNIGFAASKVMCHHDPTLIDSAGDGLTPTGRAFNMGHFNKDCEDFNTKRWVMGATGAACLYKREVLNDIGPLDDDFFLYYEDVDLSLRAQLRGYKCVYVPDAVVTHVGSAISDTISGLKTYYLTRNFFPLIIKNFPRKILQSCFIGILWHLFWMFCYNLWNFRVSSFIKGFKDGLKMIKPALAKRKKILGARRITDDEFMNLLYFGKVAYKLTRKNRQKPPSPKHITITRAEPAE